MFVDIAFFSYFCVGDDAPCHGSGDLSGQHFHSFRSFYDYGRTFVLRTGFRQPCFHEVTVVVGYLFNGAVHRIPVGMYVNDAHEDRDHQPTVMEVFVFVHFFNDYNFAVSRSDDYLFCILSEKSDRTAEEVNHQQIYCNTGYCNHIKRNFAIYSPIKGRINQ